MRAVTTPAAAGDSVVKMMGVKHDVERNIFFVENWPKGTIGALPDDAEQNMRLTFLEKQIAKHEELLEEMRYGVAK